MAIYFNYPPQIVINELTAIAQTLVSPGKGVLNTDCINDELIDLLQEMGLQSSQDNRRLFRQVLFTAVVKIKDYISGVILHKEIILESAGDGTPFIELLKKRNLVLGIAVETSFVPIVTTNDEYTTEGLDNLSFRCDEFKQMGCDFAKWRIKFKISANTPTPQAIFDNASILARFASYCQAASLVPMMEIEVLDDGYYDLRWKQKVTEQILSVLMKILHDHHIYLEGSLLKITMITPGNRCIKIYKSEDIARCTVETLRRCVPAAIPGILFIAHKMHEDLATKYLTDINNVTALKPWALTFSYGEPLYGSALKIWLGKKENVRDAQAQFIERCKKNSLASRGMTEEIYVADKVEEEQNMYTFPV